MEEAKCFRKAEEKTKVLAEAVLLAGSLTEGSSINTHECFWGGGGKTPSSIKTVPVEMRAHSLQ